MVTEPKWLKTARSLIGMREIPGPDHNAKILEWWKAMGAPYDDDETAWCGAFIDHCLRTAGEDVVNTGEMARHWLDLPVTLDQPAVGCIVVLWRESLTSWKGHVGFLVGKDSDGNLLLLGGNQDDGVNIKAFPLSQVLGYRWPSGQPDPEMLEIPIISDEQVAAWNEGRGPAQDASPVTQVGDAEGAPSVAADPGAPDGSSVANLPTRPHSAIADTPADPAEAKAAEASDSVLLRTTRAAIPKHEASSDTTSGANSHAETAEAVSHDQQIEIPRELAAGKSLARQPQREAQEPGPDEANVAGGGKLPPVPTEAFVEKSSDMAYVGIRETDHDLSV